MIKDSKILIFTAIAIFGFFFSNLQIAAFLLAIAYIVNLFASSKETIAFREFTLVMYAINYLLSPSVLFEYNDSDMTFYKMECSKDQYFTNAISGMFALHIGMFLIPTKIFKTDFSLVKIEALVNEKVLKQWLLGGLAVGYINFVFGVPDEVTFFLILLSGLKFVGMFGLVTINAKKNIYLIVGLAVHEIFWALRNAFFHDILIWIMFFGLYYLFVYKVSSIKKVGLLIGFVFFAYVVQNVKADYRRVVWNTDTQDNASIFTDVVNSKAANSEDFFSERSVVQTLIRVNQGWIAASTFNNMDKSENFAGTGVLYQYIEAAILPRFLAPNKLKAGDKEIFNLYSGHIIREGTSMGLGIFADGYVAYGYWGVVIFCFGLGLLFSIVFKIAEIWGRVSPFFILMLFPILYYAVRPDCELQITLGQLVKGTLTYWLVVSYYKRYFKTQSKILQQLEDYKNQLLEKRKSLTT